MYIYLVRMRQPRKEIIIMSEIVVVLEADEEK